MPVPLLSCPPSPPLSSPLSPTLSNPLLFCSALPYIAWPSAHPFLSLTPCQCPPGGLAVEKGISAISIAKVKSLLAVAPTTLSAVMPWAAPPLV